MSYSTQPYSSDSETEESKDFQQSNLLERLSLSHAQDQVANPQEQEEDVKHELADFRREADQQGIGKTPLSNLSQIRPTHQRSGTSTPVVDTRMLYTLCHPFLLIYVL